MGLISGLMGNASQLDNNALQQEFAQILIQEEQIHLGFKVIRDLFIFTNRRLILVDKQGMTGKKVEYHSIPYSSISHFSVETAGRFDLDSELKIWVRGAQLPIQKEFKKGTNILDVQRTLAHYVLGADK